MTKKKIENTLLNIIVIRGIFLLLFSKISIFDLLIGEVISLIFILIYQKINIKRFRIWQIAILFIDTLTIMFLLSDISFFIRDNLLKHSHILPITISFLILCLYICYKGYHTFIKTLELSFYIILFLGVISLILLIPYINIHNLTLPDLNINNAIKYAITMIILFISINYLNDYKTTILDVTISFTNIILIKVLMILTLSNTLINVFKYPYVSMFKRISFFNFLDRLENVLALQYLFDYFIILSLLILTIKTILAKLIKKKA